jgi:hypothetical protein
MKKTLIILTSLFLIGCGSVKKDKEEINSKSDFNASKLDFKRFRDSSFILKPFDASKPMLIGKDTIVNVMIENHYTDRVQVIKDTIHKVDVVEIEKKNKETDNSKVYLYLFGFCFGFFALIILIILWYISKK